MLALKVFNVATNFSWVSEFADVVCVSDLEGTVTCGVLSTREIGLVERLFTAFLSFNCSFVSIISFANYTPATLITYKTSDTYLLPNSFMNLTFLKVILFYTIEERNTLFNGTNLVYFQ